MHYISVYIKLYAKTTKIVYIGKDMRGQDSYDVYIDTPPVDGQANQKLIQILADYLKISKSKISIDKGHKSRNKIVSIDM